MQHILMKTTGFSFSQVQKAVALTNHSIERHIESLFNETCVAGYACYEIQVTLIYLFVVWRVAHLSILHYFGFLLRSLR